MIYKTTFTTFHSRCQTKHDFHFPSFTKDYLNDLKIEKKYCNIEQEGGHQKIKHVDTFLEGKKQMRWYW